MPGTDFLWPETVARALACGSDMFALYVFHNSNPGDDFHGLVWC